MSQKTGMVTRTIQRDLASLHEKGILTREGGRKDGKWVVKKLKGARSNTSAPCFWPFPLAEP